MDRECVQYAVAYDDMHADDIADKYYAWLGSLFESLNLIFLKIFVAKKFGGRGPLRYVGKQKGSYNLVLQFHFDDGLLPARIALRLPLPGFCAQHLVAERLENEVNWLQYLEQNTTVPVPHIYSWGLRGNGNGDIFDTIGPYILMDHVEGVTLHTCLKDWEKKMEAAEGDSKDKTDDNDNDKTKEDAAADAADAVAKRAHVFEQLAGIFLQLQSHRFDKIGSITADRDGGWAVTRRPLTPDMHSQLKTMPNCSTDWWHTGPLSDIKEYVALAMSIRDQQMQCLRNINIPGTWNKIGNFEFQEGDAIDMERALKTARGRVLSRRSMAMPEAFAHLDSERSEDPQKFVLFNADLSNTNILVDPATARITALIDFEFTSAVPAALADDPPTWLISKNLGWAVIFGHSIGWHEYYQPTLDAFLEAMERVETRLSRKEDPPLSARMRASWDSKTYLVNYALRRANLADTIYHDQPQLFPAVPEAVAKTEARQKEVHEYEEYTKLQIGLYEAERIARRGTKQEE